MRKIERQLRERLKASDARVAKLESDREKFRTHFANRFRWWIELVGEGKNASAKWLIESDAKFLTEVERWFW